MPEGRHPRSARLAAATLVACLAALGSPDPARAIVWTFGCAAATSCTLAELLGGASMQVNTKRFRDFELELLDPDGVSPDFSMIVVEGRDDGGLSPGNGLRFDGNGELLVVGADRLDMAIGFVVEELDPGVDLTENSLSVISDAVTGTGFYTLGEFVADGVGVGIGQKRVENDPFFAPPIASDAIGFVTTQKTLRIEKDFLLVGSDPADSVEIVVFEQRFAQLPEPDALVSLLVCAGALHLLHRRRTRADRRAAAGPQRGGSP
jgi:hypothetical protein